MGSFVGRFDTEHIVLTVFTVQSSLHCSLDLYAAIAILPTEDVLKSILRNLEYSNAAWEETTRSYRSSVNRPIFFPPFKAVPWQVLVLHPDAVCPEGSPIAILANPTLGRVENPLWVNHYPVHFILCDSNKKPRVFFHGDPGAGGDATIPELLIYDPGDAGGDAIVPVLPTTRLVPEPVCVMAAIINAN